MRGSATSRSRQGLGRKDKGDCRRPAQLPKLDIRTKTIRIQRFAQLPPTDGIDMNVIQLSAFPAAVKADIPFRLHLEPG